MNPRSWPLRQTWLRKATLHSSFLVFLLSVWQVELALAEGTVTLGVYLVPTKES
jgi:hypothetical protein